MSEKHGPFDADMAVEFTRSLLVRLKYVIQVELGECLTSPNLERDLYPALGLIRVLACEANGAQFLDEDQVNEWDSGVQQWISKLSDSLPDEELRGLQYGLTNELSLIRRAMRNLTVR